MARRSPGHVGRDVRAHNREAWNKLSRAGDRWTVPVSDEAIAQARQGRWQVVLTETRPVPAVWFPPLSGLEVLCLASGGGQQAPVLAAAGARVTSLDNSPAQLSADQALAERHSLDLVTIEGDMRNLHMLADSTFDLVFHPVSNLFVPDIQPVWREAFRVLRPGGILLAGFVNPFDYLFDRNKADEGIFEVRFALPYSDVDSLPEEERAQMFGQDSPLEFGHSLTEQIGGQIAAGFVIAGFYEDVRDDHPQAALMPSYIATRALKLG